MKFHLIHQSCDEHDKPVLNENPEAFKKRRWGYCYILVHSVILSKFPRLLEQALKQSTKLEYSSVDCESLIQHCCVGSRSTCVYLLKQLLIIPF